MSPQSSARSAKIGIYIKILSALSFTFMNACIKGLDGAMPTGEVVFFRSFFALVPLFVWLRYQGDVLSMIGTRSVGSHVIRGISGSFGMFFNFVALAYLPLADAVMLGYAAPLLTVVMAALLLKEKVKGYRWMAVVVGFAGVVIVLSPHFMGAESRREAMSGAILIGAAMGFTGACFSALSAVQIRRMALIEKPGSIVLYFSLMTTVIGALTILLGWKMPNTPQLLLLIGSGIFGGIGQTLIALSMRRAEASLIAPFEYTTMIWSVLLAYFAFDQLPTIATFVGGAVIAGSGIYTIWRESRARPSVAAAAVVTSTAT